MTACWPSTGGPLPEGLDRGDGRRRASIGRQVIALEMQVEALTAANAALAAELAEMRLLVPPRPPKGWICVKRAADMAGYSEPAIYKSARTGKILSVKLAGRIWIDPASLRRTV